MGLGKTVQALAHLLTEKAAGRADRPSLVVAPTSVLGNWRSEAARFAPQLRVLTLHGPQRKADFERVPDFDLVLSTYPLLPRDVDALSAARVPPDHSGRGAEHQERPHGGHQSGGQLEGAPPPVPHRHAAGKPPGRAVVAVQLSDAGPALLRKSLRAALPHARREAGRPGPPRRAGRPRPALPPAAREERGGPRTAAQNRDPGAPLARKRPARPLRDRARDHAGKSARGTRRARPGAQHHRRARRAAQAAPGRHRSQAGQARRGPQGQEQRQARLAAGQPAADGRGRPPGADLQRFCQLAGLAGRHPRRAGHSLRQADRPDQEPRRPDRVVSGRRESRCF